MNLELVDIKDPDNKRLQVTEWAWAPIRSILAIANRLEHEETGDLPVSYENLKDLDENRGEGISDPEVCRRLAARLKNLAQDPLTLVAYGMTADMEDGSFWYTYPSEFCTAAMEERRSKIIVNQKDKVNPNNTRSMLRASEAELNEVIEFLDTSNGFVMP